MVRRIEARVWSILTEERLTSFITNMLGMIWPNKTLIKEIAMGDDKGSHSNPYPKMPWESGDGGGSHRKSGKGCFSMVSVPVVVVLCLLALMVECVWW